LFYTQQYSRAIDCYQKILEIDPDNSFAWYNSACSYALLGDLDRAITNLKKAIQLNPEELLNTAKNDSDFALLQEDERFKQLLELEN
jgi:tetratricopeptide (TPR) repeat protein